MLGLRPRIRSRRVPGWDGCLLRYVLEYSSQLRMPCKAGFGGKEVDGLRRNRGMEVVRMKVLRPLILSHHAGKHSRVLLFTPPNFNRALCSWWCRAKKSWKCDELPKAEFCRCLCVIHRKHQNYIDYLQQTTNHDNLKPSSLTLLSSNPTTQLPSF